MNRHPDGLRLVAAAALLASLLASADLTASAPPPGAPETNAAPSMAPSSTTNTPVSDAIAPSNPLPDSPDSSSTPPRAEREGNRSRRTDRRRDRDDSSANVSSSSTNLPAHGSDLASFQIIPERNIFNVNRSSRANRAASRAPTPKPTQVDTVALVGAMSYAKGDFAFFDGSSSDFRKALKPGDAIAGFQIRSIGQQSVQLEASGRSLELPIGSHLRREDDGEWRLVSEKAPEPSSAYGSGSRSGSETNPDNASATPAGSADAAAGDANDVLMRLMKKREQELK